MKIGMLVVSALAALAVSGVFAAAATAEQTQGPTYGFFLCEPMDPAEEAYFADPSRTEPEIQETWKAYVLRSCATLKVPMSEADAAGRSIDACLAPHMPSFSKADAEDCIAAWSAGSGSGPAQFRLRRAKKQHKAKGKPHRAQRTGGIALASALR